MATRVILHRRAILMALGLLCWLPAHVSANVSAELPAEERVLTLADFISQAAAHDTEFETILIEELIVQYQRDLTLPARDLVLSIKQEFAVFLDDGEEGSARTEPATTVGLSKLFPTAGTEVDLSYTVTPSRASSREASDVRVTLTQPIARNAFGRSTRLLDRIVGLEVDIARHQIIEAYEDYLATLMLAYVGWYKAYEDVHISQSSYHENLKLLENMRARQDNRIALPIDVNKISLQVAAKEEALIQRAESYQAQWHVIERAIRHRGPVRLIPAQSAALAVPQMSFEIQFAQFESGSRTYQVLRLLDEQSGIEVARDADDLLPSINLLLGYDVEAMDHDLRDSAHMVFAGVSMDWPVPDQVNRAEHQVSQLQQRHTALEIDNTHQRLYVQLKNVYHAIERERALFGIAQGKIQLAESILEDETENYRFGKVSLNDYIDAVNVLDTNRFNLVLHEVQLQQLLIEWQRLTDQLVSRADVSSRHPAYFQ